MGFLDDLAQQADGLRKQLGIQPSPFQGLQQTLDNVAAPVISGVQTFSDNLNNFKNTANEIFGNAGQELQNDSSKIGLNWDQLNQKKDQLFANFETSTGLDKPLPPYPEQVQQNFQRMVQYNPISLYGNYLKNSVFGQIGSGINNIENSPTLPGKGMGAFQTFTGVLNALPQMTAFNLAFGGLAGAARAIRTGQPWDQSIYQGATEPTSLAAQGLGIKNPFLALGVDVLAGHVMGMVPSEMGLINSETTGNSAIDSILAKRGGEASEITPQGTLLGMEARLRDPNPFNIFEVNTGKDLTWQKFEQNQGAINSPEARDKMIGIAQKLPQAYDDLQTSLQQVAKDTGATPVMANTGVKQLGSWAGKVLDKIGIEGDKNYAVDTPQDLVRGTLVVPNEQAAQKTMQYIQDNFNVVGKPIDYFANPNLGYRGLHANVELPNGIVSEIQIHTPESLTFKLDTLKLYEKYGAEKWSQLPIDAKNEIYQESLKDFGETPTGDKLFTATRRPGSYSNVPNIDNPLLPGGYLNPRTAPSEASVPNIPGIKGPPPPINSSDIQGALVKRFSIMQSVDQRSNILQQLIDKGVTSVEETRLFRNAIENPTKLDSNAEQVANPQMFKTAVHAYEDFTDYVYNNLKLKGSKVGYLMDYYSHILDLSDPNEAARYEAYVASKARNYQGWFNRDRVFSNIDDLEAAGFKLKNPTASLDVKEYGQSAAKELGSRTFSGDLSRLSPGDIYQTTQGEAPPSNFIQLKIPGMKGTYVSDRLYPQLSHLETPNFNQVVSTMDKVNTGIKNIKLAGGGFHAINTSLDYIGNEIASLRIPKVDQMVKVFFSPDAMLSYKNDAMLDGSLDKAGEMGVTIGKMSDLGNFNSDTVSTVKSLNPITWLHQATFDRLINFFKLETVRNIDTSQMTDKEVRDVGAQINNMFGGQNLQVMQRSPTVQLGLRYLTLAADYQEGRFRRTLTAFNPTDFSPAASLARTSLAGRVLVTAIMAEVGRKITTGNFDTNAKDLVEHALLDPTIPIGTNNKGQQETASLPASNISDIYRAITDPRHFAISHMAAVPSIGLQALNNQNYYGQPLVDPFDKDQSALAQAKALAAANLLPIPAVQGQKVLSDKTSARDAFLNTVGLRVKVDPNDPTLQYFAALKQAGDSLDPNQQKVFYGVIHPTTKDRSGNSVIDKNTLTTPTKYEAFLEDPQLLQTEKALQQSQPNHDPLWDLPDNQLKAYMQAQVISKNNPRTGFGADPTVTALYSKIPQSFFNARTMFFNSLMQQTPSGISNGTAAGSTTTPVTANQPASQPQQIADFWNKYYQLPQGSAQRKAMINSQEGQQALTYTAQEKQTTNAQRADMGLPLLATSGTGLGSGYTYYKRAPAFIRNSLRGRPPARIRTGTTKIYKPKPVKQKKFKYTAPKFTGLKKV